MARHAATTAYLCEHLCLDLDDDVTAAGERFWRELETGRTPASLTGSSPEHTPRE